MTRLLCGVALAMLTTIAYAQDEADFNAPTIEEAAPVIEEAGAAPAAGEIEMIVDEQTGEEIPVMTSFPEAVLPVIVFGNQCPPECNPCNANLWDNYCAERVLWCEKSHHCRRGCGHCGGCGQCGCAPTCGGCNSCSAYGSCNECSGVPCAQLGVPTRLPDTVGAESSRANAVARRPRPSGSPLPFWSPSEAELPGVER